MKKIDTPNELVLMSTPDERVSKEPKPLTKKELKIYRYLCSYIKHYKYAPTLKEVQKRFGYRAMSTVHEYIENLKNKGYIKKVMNQARGITIIEKNSKIL